MNFYQHIFPVYFLIYSLYSLYRLHFLLEYIKGFYKKGILSEQDYSSLHDKYTGFLRYYYPFPDRNQYAVLYEDAEFSQFSLRMRRVRIFLVVTGIAFALIALFTRAS